MSTLHNKKNILPFLAFALFFMGVAHKVHASEIVGNLNTGLSASTGGQLSGTVVVPSPSPTTITPLNGGGANGGLEIRTVAPVKPEIRPKKGKTISDFVALMTHWGKSGNTSTDLNNDTVIDIKDFVVLMAQWKK